MKPPSPPSKRELTHQRIVQSAARALRRSGYAGVGVADVMREAGLTHGGFYAHFPSREALLVEAVEQAGRESAESLARSVERQRGSDRTPLRALVESYLSDAHLQAVEDGCPVSALASEMGRQSAEVRAASTRSVEKLIERIRQTLPPDPAARERASVIAATLVGALQLARAAGSQARGKAILAAARRSLLAAHDAG